MIYVESESDFKEAFKSNEASSMNDNTNLQYQLKTESEQNVTISKEYMS